MSTPDLLLQVLKAEMRAAGITYKALAPQLGLSESSLKRVFSQGDMTLSRLEQICQAVGVAMEDVLRQAADAAPRADTLTLEQERSLVADPQLLLVAICCLGHWTLEQMTETYMLSEAECIARLVQLDRLAVIELKPLNRYRLRVARTFHWRPDGPVQQFFRDHVAGDYFAGRFDGAGDTLLLAHARISEGSARALVQKIRQLAGEMAQRHQDDQRLEPDERDGYTMVLALQCWEFAGFTAMRRQPLPTAAPPVRRLPAIAPDDD